MATIRALICSYSAYRCARTWDGKLSVVIVDAAPGGLCALYEPDRPAHYADSKPQA